MLWTDGEWFCCASSGQLEYDSLLVFQPGELDELIAAGNQYLRRGQ